MDNIIAMGIHLDDIQEYIDSTQSADRKLISKLTMILVAILSIISIASYIFIVIVNKLYIKYTKRMMEAEINRDTLTNAFSRRYGTNDLIRAYKDFMRSGESILSAISS